MEIKKLLNQQDVENLTKLVVLHKEMLESYFKKLPLLFESEVPDILICENLIAKLKVLASFDGEAKGGFKGEKNGNEVSDTEKRSEARAKERSKSA